MPFTDQTLAVKRYNECIICDHLGINCDGPNLTAIDTPRFCEWCKLLRDKRGYTNARLAEISGVSLATVERIMAGRSTGLNADTKSDIACALIYGKAREGAWGKDPCAMISLGLNGADELAAAREECESLRSSLHAAEVSSKKELEEARVKINHLKSQIAHHEDQSMKKDELLRDRHSYLKTKDSYIRIFLTTSALSILANIALLVWIITALV